MRSDPTLIFLERCGPVKASSTAAAAANLSAMAAAAETEAGKEGAAEDNPELVSGETEMKGDEEPMDTEAPPKSTAEEATLSEVRKWSC